MKETPLISAVIRVKDEIHWGHLCIVLGAKASTYVWPFLAEWMLERCD